ncbi:MAG: hypothetical protein RRA92_08850 [Gemmatimonadota bacterium]|nr:hypothetical protein [Gemmatimonadota bacterium]
MRRLGTRAIGRTARRLAAVAAAAGAGLLLTLAAVAQERDEGVRETVVTLSSREATLRVELAAGTTRTVSLTGGRILVDGTPAGSYEPGAAVERAWRELLRDPRTLESATTLSALRDWVPPAGPDGEALGAALASLVPAPDGVDAAHPVSEALGDGPVAIAPGLRSMEELTRGIDRLRRSLARIGAQARVSGDEVALVVHDDYAVPAGRVVGGDLVLLGGELELAGEVNGDVLVLDGVLTLADGSRVAGDIVQVGGEVRRDGGRVVGEIVSLAGGAAAGLEDALADLADSAGEAAADAASGDEPRIRVERRSGRRGPVGAFFHNLGHMLGSLGAVLGWYIGLGLLGAALVYFFRPRLEMVADAVRLDVGRCFGIGLAGQLLFLPVLLVLAVGIVTWLVIPFYVLAAALAVPAGYLAAAHAAGETIALRRYDWVERLRLRRANSYWYVASGLAALLAPFAVAAVLFLFCGLLGFLRGLAFFAAGVTTWVAVSAGLGGLIVTRAGGRRPAGRGADPLREEFAPGTEASGA